jgi:hypothetical protein
MAACSNCERTIVGEGGTRVCSDCRRMYRRVWEDGWTAPIRNGVYDTAEGMEDFCEVDMLAGLTPPQVAALADQIDTEPRWRDGDDEVAA